MIEVNTENYLFASVDLKVPFNDLDPGNVVWHGRYFKYFESARTALFESIGYSYKEMAESGVLWPVADVNVRFVKPLILDQEFCVTACLKEWELRLVVDYDVVDIQGGICTRARTVQVPVDANTHELMFGSPEVLVNNVQECLQALTPGND